MKVKETFLVVSSEKKSGTSARGPWEKTEYLLKNVLERDDGSMVDTYITADTSMSVGELKVGATYEATVFISSREFEKDGKKSHFVSFRVTNATMLQDAQEKKAEAAPTSVEQLGDDIPFNNPF